MCKEGEKQELVIDSPSIVQSYTSKFLRVAVKAGLAVSFLKSALRYFRYDRNFFFRQLLAYFPSFSKTVLYLLGISLVKYFASGTRLLPGGQLPLSERRKLADELSKKDYTRRFLKRKHEIASHLSESLKFKTVSYDYDSPDQEADYGETIKLHKYLEKTYPNVHKVFEKHVVNDYSLVYVWEGTEDTLQRPYLLYAHMDVVPAIAKDWSEDPFSGRIKDDYIYGRGAIDLKHMVVGWMECFEDLIKSGFKPKRSIYLALGHDEEVSGYRGAKQISEWFVDQGFADEPFEFMWDEGLFVIDNAIGGHPGPVALICCSEKGSMTLKLSVTTAPGHSSFPPKEGSIGILSRAVSKLELNPKPGNIAGVAEHFFDLISTGFKGYMRYIMVNLWLFGPLLTWVLERKPQTAALVRTSTALTIFRSGYKFNVCPEKATATVNHRIHPSDTIENVVEYDRKIIDDPRVKIEISRSLRPSPVSSSQANAFQTLKRCVHAQYPDASVGPGLFIANSDSRHFWDVADNIYRFNPIRITNEETKLFHGIDERISIDNLVRVCIFMRNFIEQTDATFSQRKHAKSKYNE